MKRLIPLPSSVLLSAVLALASPRPEARADDSIDYKYENYREEDGRITVVTQSGSVDEDVGQFGHLGLTGTIDAVAGATPTGRPAPPGSDQVVLPEIHTRRKAWSGDYSEQFGIFNIDAGFAESRESDYVSLGWSVNTLTDFNEKNTTLRAGLAGTDDRVEVFFEPAYLPKHTDDAILGVTQLLDPLTFVTVNLSAGNSSGDLSEPHKLVEKGVEILPGLALEEAFAENRPNERDRESIYAALNRAFPKLRGALEASYRLYGDSFGIVAHTLGLAWIQHVGGAWLLEPSVRLYRQTAASFYYYNLDDTPITPARSPNGTGPYYSSDFRLSEEESVSCGLKATWKATAWVHVEASYERYAIRGLDGVTPQSAYPTANITTLGAKFLW